MENNKEANIPLRGTAMEDMAKRVLGKESVTDQELKLVAIADAGFSINQITISASETRQVRQYESNNYFISIQYDLTAAGHLLKEITNATGISEEEKIKRYMEHKRLLFKMLADKYMMTEDFLRDLIKKQQTADGIKG